jgi:hypothetical protein
VIVGGGGGGVGSEIASGSRAPAARCKRAVSCHTLFGVDARDVVNIQIVGVVPKSAELMFYQDHSSLIV